MQRAEQRAIFVLPCRCREALSGGCANRASGFHGAVHLPYPELEDTRHVADTGEVLRCGQSGECPVGVVIVEAGIEYAALMWRRSKRARSAISLDDWTPDGELPLAERFADENPNPE